MGKILVAEDSLIVNQHIKHSLESGNHEVLSAFSGREAVQIANQALPDLILMDIMMETSSDGLDAAMEIKQTLDIPIIFLTALTDEPTIKKAMVSLPYGYVVKPFNEAELLSNIHVALYKAQAEKQIKGNSELFQTIINSIDQAIFLLNSSGLINYTNGVAEGFINKKFDVLINKPVSDFLTFYSENKPVDFNIFRNENLVDLELKMEGSDSIFGDFQFKTISLDQDYSLLIFKDISDKVRAKKVKEDLKNRQVASLIEGQENERERIARDLHDGVGQIANMVKLAAKKEKVGEELIELIDHFLDEMRKVTEGLLPSRLTDFPIDVCIRKIVDQANNSSDISFSFTSEDVPDIEMKLKVNLYRIAQENLSNILKHSQAKTASVQLYGFDDHVQMTFEDDGVGFEVGTYQDENAHHGLQNIIFRSEVLKATCDFDSQKGRGTFISIKIPLNGKD
jgi:signal transduction histidine kinase